MRALAPREVFRHRSRARSRDSVQGRFAVVSPLLFHFFFCYFNGLQVLLSCDDEQSDGCFFQMFCFCAERRSGSVVVFVV